MFALVIDKDGNQSKYNYIDGWKEIYIREYSRLVRDLTIYKKLVEELKETGKNIVFVELDVSKIGKAGLFGKLKDYGNNTFNITKDIINELENFDGEPFCHGLVLDKMILEDLDKKEDWI